MNPPDHDRPPVYDPFVWSNVPLAARMGEEGWRTVFGRLSTVWLPIGRAVVAALEAKGIRASIGDATSAHGAMVDLSVPDLQCHEWFNVQVMIVHDKHDRGTPAAVRVVAGGGRSPYRGSFKPSNGNWLRPAEAAAAKVSEILEATRRALADRLEYEKRKEEAAAEAERLRREELGDIQPPENVAFMRVGDGLWSVSASLPYGGSVELGTFSPEDVKALVALLEKGRRG